MNPTSTDTAQSVRCLAHDICGDFSQIVHRPGADHLHQALRRRLRPRKSFDFASFALGRRTGPDRPGGFVGFCRPACSTSALDSREGHRSYLDAFAIGVLSVLSGTPSTILVTAWGPSPLGGDLRNFSTEARFTNSAHISALVRLYAPNGTVAAEKEISHRIRSE